MNIEKKEKLMAMINAEGRIQTSDLSSDLLDVIPGMINERLVMLKKFDKDIYAKSHDRLIEYIVAL